MKHHQPEVEKDRAAKKLTQPSSPRDSLALIAQSHTTPLPYPQSNHAYIKQQQHFAYPSLSNFATQGHQEQMYNSQATADSNDSFNNLKQGMMLRTKEFSKFSTTNNCIRTLSNPRNQAVVKGGRVNVKGRNQENGQSLLTGNGGNTGYAENTGTSHSRVETADIGVAQNRGKVTRC